MNGFEALGQARRLIDQAKRDGRLPAGLIAVERPQDRRQGKFQYMVVHGEQLQHEIHGKRFLGFIDENSTDEQIAAMLLEVA